MAGSGFTLASSAS